MASDKEHVAPNRRNVCRTVSISFMAVLVLARRAVECIETEASSCLLADTFLFQQRTSNYVSRITGGPKSKRRSLWTVLCLSTLLQRRRVYCIELDPYRTTPFSWLKRSGLASHENKLCALARRAPSTAMAIVSHFHSWLRQNGPS
jgi:hypothetical protein